MAVGNICLQRKASKFKWINVITIYIKLTSNYMILAIKWEAEKIGELIHKRKTFDDPSHHISYGLYALYNACQ